MPNPPKPDYRPFLTFIPGRSKEWKQHSNIGHVKTAIMGSFPNFGYPSSGHVRIAQVFRLVDGEWELMWEIPTNTPRSELPWNKEEN
jgi:hypothetical protein